MPVFMGDVPEYKIRNDNMHITFREIEIVLPVHIMLAAMGRARREVEEWQRRTATVVSLHPADHAARS
jgi:hypothetical protein